MRITAIGFIFLLVFALPDIGLASHRDNDDWWGGVDRDELDDDIVKDIPIPVLFSVEYENINPDFGDLRGNGTREHEGEDMLAPQGTPIVSPTEAIVIRTGRGSSAGNYVYTAAPGGETFRYMHLESIADLERGDELDVGDFIGTVGDTGNAGDGVYHLHFEVRDDDNDPTDPYPRLIDGFDLEEKIEFLDGVFRDIDDEDEYAEFLVDTFPEEMTEALRENYDLPEEVEEALENAGIMSRERALERLEKILSSIPPLLSMRLAVGDQGPAVTLLQLYLIYGSEGPARDQLASATATGYFGPITSAAISEYQTTHDVPATGMYDAATRADMMDTK